MSTTATLHVLRLAEPATARQIMRPPAPAGTLLWLAGTAVRFQPDGMFESDPHRAYLLGLWDDESARHAFCDEGATGSWPAPFVEGWHASLRPYRSHGEANWIDGPLFGDASSELSPGPTAPIVTMTTTAFSDDPDRALALGAAMHEVQSVDDAAGRLRTGVSLGRKKDDGRTFTLWRTETDAVAWAYHSSPHREMIARQRTESLMPRSSFTRFAIERAWGTWDGADPLA